MERIIFDGPGSFFAVEVEADFDFQPGVMGVAKLTMGSFVLERRAALGFKNQAITPQDGTVSILCVMGDVFMIALARCRMVFFKTSPESSACNCHFNSYAETILD